MAKGVFIFIKKFTFILVFNMPHYRVIKKFNVGASNQRTAVHPDWIPACAGMTRFLFLQK
jgi:hypothetical protein